MSILEVMNETIQIPDHYKNMNIEEMEARIREIKAKFGTRLYIPGHHYQKDEVIQFADDTGDSLKLAQLSANNTQAEFIVFCGVHFMAETADILTNENQKVFLPDMRAGCSMADMANIEQTNLAWTKLQHIFGDTLLPLTYVNSTAEIKAFCGRNGGATVTSSNAKNMVEWAFTKKERVFFLPDQHLGRNTACELGISLENMAIWDPELEELQFEGDVNNIKVVLWKGYCSVHEKFTVENIEEMRNQYKDINIIVHPECTHDVVQLADFAGSTNYIIDKLQEADPDTVWAVGTEMNLVKRLAQIHADKKVMSLNPNMCPCLTMNRIDLAHLLWSLESIEKGNPINQIIVNKDVAKDAVKAVDRMLHRS
ncbi:quinolinate synthetase [Anaerobacillus alkalidiazotrophicus]|uniref:Quinolinate synthase n=1 Tax=Anaerobacillus alkalidiazotrophicus TaxID=472963 RepID=A0A1S2MBG0_9BACI|nr:quinolinate synthase NadA [Anaerobacillus alkalidiazotrophicus]OIJ21950.1 quinolinate synthetase [Anaerobacillus alkalidiazotrophicus]